MDDYDEDDEEDDELARMILSSSSENNPTGNTVGNRRNHGALPAATSVSGSNTAPMQGINRLQATTEDNDLFKKAMIAMTTFANKASAGSNTEETLKQAIGVISNAQKRKIDEEPEEEEPILITGMIDVHDDGFSSIDMSLRKRLKNPNSCPSEWWEADKMDKVTRPVTGTNLYLSHIMPGRINPKTIRRVHDRSMLVTTKSLSSQNSAVTGEKRMTYRLAATEDDDTILTGSRAYVDCKTVFEVMDSVMNFVALIHQIRPYSYEGIALMRALHHIRYYFGVSDDAKTQKTLVEKLVAETLSYNQRRGADKKHPATFKKVMELAKEVAITSGISADLLVLKCDPYCGRKDAISSTNTRKVAELEKEVKELRNSRGNPNRGGQNNYGQRNRQDRGRGRTSYNNNYGSNFRPNQNQGGNQPYTNNGQQNANGNPFFMNQGNSSNFAAVGAANQPQQDVSQLTRSKLAETCVLFNGGGDCDGSCGLRHVCSNVLRPGHLCWKNHRQIDHI